MSEPNWLTVLAGQVAGAFAAPTSTPVTAPPPVPPVSLPPGQAKKMSQQTLLLIGGAVILGYLLVK